MRIILLILAVSLLFRGAGSVFADSVVLNEIMPNPNDDTEWVELYNPTNQVIDLSNWKIKDGNTKTNDDVILSGQIDAMSFVTFDHTKGWLNDSGSETVSLLDGSGQVMDSYSYSGTSKGKSFGRQPDGASWVADLDPTKGAGNGGSPETPVPATNTPAPTISSAVVPTATPKSKATSTPLVSSTATSKPTPLETAQYSVAITTVSKSPKIPYRAASVAGAVASSTPLSKTEVKASKQINPLPVIGGVLVLTGISSVIFIYFRSR